jgi:hypothetical protein
MKLSIFSSLIRGSTVQTLTYATEPKVKVLKIDSVVGLISSNTFEPLDESDEMVNSYPRRSSPFAAPSHCTVFLSWNFFLKPRNNIRVPEKLNI